MSRTDPTTDTGYRHSWGIPCAKLDHPEGQHHHLKPYPEGYSFAESQTLDSAGVRVEKHYGTFCCTGVQLYYSHVTSEDDRMAAARAYAERELGAPEWADKILAVYRDPWTPR